VKNAIKHLSTGYVTQILLLSQCPLSEYKKVQTNWNADYADARGSNYPYQFAIGSEDANCSIAGTLSAYVFRSAEV